jgi:hypothetical protein
MPSITKTEALIELARLGELPPKDWSAMEVIQRMEEVRISKGLHPNPKHREVTPLRKMVIKLNEAARKKDHLREYAASLGVPLTGNDTIPSLQKKTLMAIYDHAAVSSEDPVGFGKYASLTYQELYQKDAQYLQWVLNTAKEGNCDARLSRLARWCQNIPHTQKVQNEQNMNAAPAIPLSVLINKGYLKTSQVPKLEETSMISGASGSATSSQMAATNAMIQQLASTVLDLMEEVQDMKEHRGARKEPKIKTDSNESFSMLSEA